MADEPIVVLRVIARLNMGGPALHVAYLSEGLADRGYDTTLVVGELARGEGSMAFVAESREIKMVRLSSLSREIAPVRDLVALLRLTRLIREQRPHIVHTHTAKAGAIGRVAALLAGGKARPIVVHTFHGHVLRGYFGPLRTIAFRTLERLLARVSTKLVAVSPEVRDELVSLGVAPPEKFVVVRLGVELGERVCSSDRAETRRQLGLPPERFVIGWVGRMTAVKRVEDALEAFRILLDRGVDATLCLVGDGPDRDQLERLAKELGVIRHCLFLGYQEEMGRWFEAFDVFVLPSANEGTPVSAIEALAAGCPVVATRVGGVPDVVEDGETGFLVESGDNAELAARLEQLASDPGLRERFGEAGKESVATRYAVGRLVDDIDRLYRSLLT
ncbi:MAG: glycosyltransferase family 4 protein [Actinomycetota bacterium]|nr:glycosyltransferase family 4 protein [Actinomycetota bacterium]